MITALFYRNCLITFWSWSQMLLSATCKWLAIVYNIENTRQPGEVLSGAQNLKLPKTEQCYWSGSHWTSWPVKLPFQLHPSLQSKLVFTWEHKCMNSTYFFCLIWGERFVSMRHIKRDAKPAGCPVVAGPAIRTMAIQAKDPAFNSWRVSTFHFPLATAHIKFIGVLMQCRVELPPTVHTLILVYKCVY